MSSRSDLQPIVPHVPGSAAVPRVPSLGFRCSRLVFGTASLFNAGGAAQRRRLLDAAVEQGFTHFDTAPLYGFGMAERDLAPLLRAHPGLTVATKVGLYPPGGPGQPSAAIVLRKAAGKVWTRLSAPRRSFDLAQAQASLEGSLRRLGREYVDVYLLHEPSADIVDIDAWSDWLQGRVRAGQLRTFGVAGPLDVVGALADSALAPVLQTADSLDRREADALLAMGRPLQLTYGYLSAALQRGDTRAASQILIDALQRNATGAVLVSTTRVERMPVYGQLMRSGA